MFTDFLSVCQAFLYSYRSLDLKAAVHALSTMWTSPLPRCWYIYLCILSHRQHSCCYYCPQRFENSPVCNAEAVMQGDVWLVGPALNRLHDRLLTFQFLPVGWQPREWGLHLIICSRSGEHSVHTSAHHCLLIIMNTPPPLRFPLGTMVESRPEGSSHVYTKTKTWEYPHERLENSNSSWVHH